LVDNFPAETSRRLIRLFCPGDPLIQEVDFSEPGIGVQYANGRKPAASGVANELLVVRRRVEAFFQANDGFDAVIRINLLDGVRVWFNNGDIAHIRPSGNAPQLRIYAVSNSQARADVIVRAAIAEPSGILRRIESAVMRASCERVIETFANASPEPQSQCTDPIRLDFVTSIRKNISLATDLLTRGETPEVLALVAGSKFAQEFWQSVMNNAREAFHARSAISFVEDLPTNQAFGLLLLWQRLKPHVRENRGSLAAFVFGEGTRSTPFTETESAQKPALATFVSEGPLANSGNVNGEGACGGTIPLFNGSHVKSQRVTLCRVPPVRRYLSMVELALRHFVPVQQFLRRSGFNGLVVKWGDEVQIPTRDLSGSDALFRDADVVRFVSVREINPDEARNKDWVGVNEAGYVTAFIPRRPIEQMNALADRGLLQRRGDKLWGGVNLGSIAVSYALLDCLLEEFGSEVNDAGADRRERPALDPEFFTALTIAAIADPRERAEAWEMALAESAEVCALAQRFTDIIYRLRRVVGVLEARQGRQIKLVAMDFEDQYWGDIGQHPKIYEFYMTLNQNGRAGDVARAIAGLEHKRDSNGNLIINSHVSSSIIVRNSVLIDVTLTGSGIVEHSVLVGTRARDVEIREGFDVLSTVAVLRIFPCAGAYRVVSKDPVCAHAGERLTTLFLPGMAPRLFRVKEETDLKDKRRNYSVPILENPMSFERAHQLMGTVTAEELESRRAKMEAESMELVL
jgi:phosphomannomutase